MKYAVVDENLNGSEAVFAFARRITYGATYHGIL